MSADTRNLVAKVLAPNPDYKARVGVRKATGNVAGNAVVAAAPATFLVMVARYNGLNLWPVEADAAAATAIMTALTGITRWVGDWHRMNVVEPRWARQQADNDSPEEEQA